MATMYRYIVKVKSTGKESTVSPKSLFRVILMATGGGYTSGEVVAAKAGLERVTSGQKFTTEHYEIRREYVGQAVSAG